MQHQDDRPLDRPLDQPIDPDDHAPAQAGSPEPKPDAAIPAPPAQPVPETGGPSGLEPTRYGDWERKGRCYDF